MTQEDYLQFHADLCDEARRLSCRKNNDYAAPATRNDDPYAIFANFMQSERLNICSVEQGFLVRLSDKLSRLCNLLAPGHQQAVMDEKIEDTVMDTINYVVLLSAYLRTKAADFPEQENNPKGESVL